jgi:uncharacterized protein (DUF58 family)
MEFEEVRPYQYGDDVRSIDWNVSARTGFPHVKLFREERELTVMLAVDLSGSLSFGTHAQLKRELAAEIAATIAFSAIRSNDRVGLVCFTDRVERVVPPRKGSRHVLRIVRDLLGFEPSSRGTDIRGAIAEATRMLSRRSVLFVVSDWRSNTVSAKGGEPWEDALRIARMKHDVIPVLIRDRREHAMPALGLAEFMDEETGECIVVDLGSKAVRNRFAQLAAAEGSLLDETLRKLRSEAIRVETGGDFVAPLTTFFRRREARRAR